MPEICFCHRMFFSVILIYFGARNLLCQKYHLWNILWLISKEKVFWEWEFLLSLIIEIITLWSPGTHHTSHTFKGKPYWETICFIFLRFPRVALKLKTKHHTTHHIPHYTTHTALHTQHNNTHHSSDQTTGPFTNICPNTMVVLSLLSLTTAILISP